LLISTYYGSRYKSGHAVAVKKLDEDGTIEFNTWGLSLKGKLKAIPKSEKEKRISFITEEGKRGSKVVKLPQYEIELINKTELPDWFVGSEARFVLDPERWDQLLVLTPYIAINANAK
jgi:hypothetical protein